MTTLGLGEETFLSRLLINTQYVNLILITKKRETTPIHTNDDNGSTIYFGDRFRY